MKNPAALTSKVASACSAASCWRTRSNLVPVGQLGGDAVGLAVLGQFLDRVLDPGLVLADDHGGPAGGYHVGGGVAAHPAAAADHHQFLALEHGHGLLVGLVRVVVQSMEPVRAHASAPFDWVRRASKPAACARASLAAPPAPRTVRSGTGYKPPHCAVPRIG